MGFWFFKSKEERDADRMKKEGKRLLRQKKKEEERAKKQRDKQEKNKDESAEVVEESVAQTPVQESQAPEQEGDCVPAEESKEKKPRPVNYHISLREDGRWQVKKAKGERAIKIFKTQVEAIEFAKMRAESMDGSITIHKKDGKIRKQKY